jgi:hypothetical protein
MPTSKCSYPGPPETEKSRMHRCSSGLVELTQRVHYVTFIDIEGLWGSLSNFVSSNTRIINMRTDMWFVENNLIWRSTNDQSDAFLFLCECYWCLSFNGYLSCWISLSFSLFSYWFLHMLEFICYWNGYTYIDIFMVYILVYLKYSGRFLFILTCTILSDFYIRNDS